MYGDIGDEKEVLEIGNFISFNIENS